jgi:hypothetical protein
LLFLQKKRETRYRPDLGVIYPPTTTSYPHPARSDSPDCQIPGFPSSSSAYMIGEAQAQQQQLRACEVHMNSYLQQQQERQAQLNNAGPLPAPTSFLQALVYCFRSRGLMSKFPSRAKRIDVISRFIFPLIFAIFNLAYWLYYLFAKSRSPQLEQES